MEVEAEITDPLEAQLLPRADDLLRVCLVLPQSGPLGLTGPSSLDAALLAAHEVNVAGGVRGCRVDLVLVDGGRAPTVVADEVRRLRDCGAIDVVTGFHTSDVHRAIEAVTAGRTPYVFTPPHEGGPRDRGVLCIGMDPLSQLRGSMTWIATHHKARSWALIGNDYIWPRSVHKVAGHIVAELGGRVVLERRVPLGNARASVDQVVDELRHSCADAVLLSLIGRDLATFNTALRHSGLDRSLVRLSPSLEENGLMAVGGDRSGLLYASMSSFATLDADRRLDLVERHRTVLGPCAPVLDAYAEGVYDGVRLVTLLAGEQALTPSRLAAGAERLASPSGRAAHLAVADGLDFVVVSTSTNLPFGNNLS